MIDDSKIISISVRGFESHLQQSWQIYGRDQLDMPQNAYEAIVCVKYVVCNDRSNHNGHHVRTLPIRP